MRRLATPPINLSPSLIESLNIVCVFKHIKTPDKSVRRLIQIDEIIRVKEGTAGDVESNVLFAWDPVKDKQEQMHESIIIERISRNTGIPKDKLVAEWKKRVAVLKKMAEKNITDFKQVNTLINQYYKEPQNVLAAFGIK